MKIPLFKPSISSAEKERVIEVLDSCWWAYGPVAKELEKKTKEYLGCKEAIACSSCTAALHLALSLADVAPGDEVIVPAITWVSPAAAVIYLDATPVFADVDRSSLNLDPDSVEAAITNKTKAVIMVHYTGMPGPINEIHEIVKHKGIVIIEDAAHAFGATYRKKRIGIHSSFVCFSLNAVKNVAAGEGGILCFSNNDLREKAERLFWLGLSDTTFNLTKGKPNRAPAIAVQKGYKYAMPDILAAIALAQLERLDEMNRRRQQLVLAYTEHLSQITKVTLPKLSGKNTQSSWAMFVIRVPADDRDALRAYLGANDIETAIHYPPLNEQPFFIGYRGNTPVASQESRRIVTLPLFPDMTITEIDKICNIITDFFKN